MKEIKDSFIEHQKYNARKVLINLPDSIFGVSSALIGESERRFISRYRFIRAFDKDKFLSEKRKYRIIRQKDIGISMLNMCFMDRVLSIILQTLYEGCIPLIDICNTDDDNIWGMILQQPFGINLDDIYKQADAGKCELEICENSSLFLSPKFDCSHQPAIKKLWEKVFSLLIIPNPDTANYINEECRNIDLNNRRVLGVLCRGTDFTTLRPNGHPVQPAVEDVITFARKVMDEHRLDYIYLATEEKRIHDKWEDAFPGKILINKRSYYDDIYYSDKNIVTIGQVNFNRENERYYKSLEYFSSLSILSRCNALIAGNCGGSLNALLMNNNRYEYAHLFRLGYYDNKDWNNQKTK